MQEDAKHEIEELDQEVEKYWEGLDRLEQEIDWERIQNKHKQDYANYLLGSLGKDIQDVTSGKIKIKIPFKLRFKRWIEQFFRMF